MKLKKLKNRNTTATETHTTMTPTTMTANHDDDDDDVKNTQVNCSKKKKNDVADNDILFYSCTQMRVTAFLLSAYLQKAENEGCPRIFRSQITVFSKCRAR